MAKVMTVRGAIEPSELGFTSLHEHILCDLSSCYRDRFQLGGRSMPDLAREAENRSRLRHALVMSSDNLRLDDEEMMAGEVADFREAGGMAIVETGSPGIRTDRDVVAFQRISERTGVHIVACTGLYAEDSWPERFRGLSEEEYAAYLRREITDGIGESGVIPGQIKVAYEGRSASADAYTRAAARVSLETGISVQVHVGLLLSNDAMRDAFLPMLYATECVPERTLICHVENWLGALRIDELVADPASVSLDTSLHKEVLDRGFNVGFTCIGAEWDLEGMGLAHRPDWFYVAGIVALVKQGYAGQIMLGHDVFTKNNARRGGGEGYTRIQRFIVPALHRAGVSDADIERITVTNPARLLAY